MPDTTITGVQFGGNAQAAYVSGKGSRTSLIKKGGQNFDALMDATSISIAGQSMMSAPPTPQANADTNVIGETKDLNAAAVTGRSAPDRQQGLKDRAATEHTTQKTDSKATDNKAEENRITETNKGTETTTGTADTADEIDSGLTDAIRAAGEQLIPMTAEEMLVDVEAVTEAMQNLGMTPGDLLNQESLATLVSNIAGEDETALLTDSELYGKLQALSGEAEELKGDILTQFSLDTETLQEAIDITAAADDTGMPRIEVLAREPLAEEEIVLTEEEPEAVPTNDQNVRNAQTETDADTGVTVAQAEENNGNAAVQAKDPNGTNAQTTETEENAVPEAQRVQAGEANGDETGGENRGQQHTDTQGRNGRLTDTAAANRDVTTSPEAAGVYSELVNRVNNTLNAVTEAAPAAYTEANVNAEDIIRQVMDFMRLEIKADGMTEMQLRLHPESLGRVDILLSQGANGDVVARFATENDTVKAALESQMPELQKRFQEQGIRVNSVEVTVDQRAFDGDRDREMNRNDQNEQMSEALRRAGRLRRVALELNGLDDMALEDLSEEDRITVEMMRAEGNTVNYRA